MAKNWVKILLSLFIVYHLMILIISPNFHSVLGKEFGFLFIKYANTLNISMPWQFFSPDPTKIAYWEYNIEFLNPEGELGLADLEDDDLNGDGIVTEDEFIKPEAQDIDDKMAEDEKIAKEVQSHIWPPDPPKDLSLRMHYYRIMYNARISSLSAKNFRNIFMTNLCRRHQKAAYISIRSVVIDQPFLYLPENIELQRQIQKDKTVRSKFESYDCVELREEHKKLMADQGDVDADVL